MGGWTTAHAEQFWADTRRVERLGLVDVYRESARAASRQAVVDACRTVHPIGVVLEVGCHCAPLWTVLRAHPELGVTSYLGVDINPAVIAAAREDFTKDRRAYFHAGNAHVLLHALEAGCVDVVLFSSTLSTMAEADARTLLREAVRLATRAVVLQEPERGPRVWCSWHHPYPRMLTDLNLAWCDVGGVYVIDIGGGKRGRATEQQ